MADSRNMMLTEKQKQVIKDRYTLLALSKKAGVSYPAIWSAYQGRSKASFETVYKIAKALDMDFEVFRSL